MNRQDPAAILADLELLINDTRDALTFGTETERLTLIHLANARECLRKVVDPDRDSLPPGAFGTNQAARVTATGRFRNAREILKGIK